MAFQLFWTLFTILILFLVIGRIKDALTLFVPNTPEARWLLRQIDQRTLLILLTVLVGMVVINVLMGIYTLQRIAGPLHRFHQHMLSDARQRLLTPVRFRTGDYFTQLAEAYNDLAGVINPDEHGPDAGTATFSGATPDLAIDLGVKTESPTGEDTAG